MTLANAMGGQGQEQARMNSELSLMGDNDITLLDLHSDELLVWNARVRETWQDVSGSILILGNPTYGEWGVQQWGSDFEEEPLDGSVYNAHNIFPEGFWNDRFIDTGSSTGSWYEEEKYYILDGSDVLYTTYVAKEDKVYKSIRIDIDSINTTTGSDADDALLIVAQIDGSDYALTVNADNIIGNTSTDGIKLAFQNIGTSNALTFPLSFPIPFSATDPLKINEFLVTYGE